jgi:biotin--protein ligase
MNTALSSLPPHTIFITDMQTVGRGRGGNAWNSPAGCLMSNMSLRVDSAHLLPFVQYLYCWALVRSVKQLCPELNMGIKWPNDVYMDGGKVGGILCQSSVDMPVQNGKPTFTVHAGTKIFFFCFMLTFVEPSFFD